MSEMPTATYLEITCIVLFTVTAMATDLRSRRIPNWLTVTAALGGLVFHGVTQRWAGVGFSLAGFGVGFGLLLVLWLIGGGGGGDVKLMGAVGAWLGPKYTFAVFVLSVVFSMVCMITVIVYGTLKNVTRSEGVGPKNVMKKTIPYALPCALSTWSVVIVKLLTNN